MAETGSSFTYQINEEQGETLRTCLKGLGFEFSDLAYGHFGARQGKCSVSYYKSGKVVIQGKDARQFIEFTFEPVILQEARLGYEKELNPEMYAPHFGIDESGKGDFFGPLVIAGAYVDEKLAEQLLELGVKDSKKISSDAKALELADKIKRVLSFRQEVLLIGPKRYNELYLKFGNLNRLLAWGHAKVIELMHQRVPNCPRALSDQFAHPSLIQRELKTKKIEILLEQRTKAESDIAVAAASILARAGFLRKLGDLGTPYGLKLLKGCSSQVVAQGKELFEKAGAEGLREVSKAHFKTFGELTGQFAGQDLTGES